MKLPVLGALLEYVGDETPAQALHQSRTVTLVLLAYHFILYVF